MVGKITGDLRDICYWLNWLLNVWLVLTEDRSSFENVVQKGTLTFEQGMKCAVAKCFQCFLR